MNSTADAMKSTPGSTREGDDLPIHPVQASPRTGHIALDRPPGVVIVDSQLLFGESIEAVLEMADIDVYAVETTAANALSAVRRMAPDLVLASDRLPDGDGFDLGLQILLGYPGTKVVLLTASGPPDVDELIEAGFYGYLSEDTPLPQFVEAVRDVLLRNEVIRRVPTAMPDLDPRSSRRTSRTRRSKGRSGSRRERGNEISDVRMRQLTARESEVLSLLMRGTSGAAIAQELSVSPNTVRSHVRNILMKLQVGSRLEAVLFAIRRGALDPSFQGAGNNGLNADR
jgi:DNA-binding NarL/FixJ family response regulator